MCSSGDDSTEKSADIAVVGILAGRLVAHAAGLLTSARPEFQAGCHVLAGRGGCPVRPAMHGELWTLRAEPIAAWLTNWKYAC